MHQFEVVEVGQGVGVLGCELVPGKDKRQGDAFEELQSEGVKLALERSDHIAVFG